MGLFLWITLEIFTKNKQTKRYHKTGLVLPTLIGSEKAKDQTLQRVGSGFNTGGRVLGLRARKSGFSPGRQVGTAPP